MEPKKKSKSEPKKKSEPAKKRTAEFDDKKSKASETLNKLLHGFCKMGSLEGVKEALQQGADIEARDGDGGTPLSTACGFGHKEIVKYLLDHGADIESRDEYGATPLFSASCAHGSDGPEIVKILLEHGANVFARDDDGMSALGSVIVEEPPSASVETMKILLETGLTIVDEINITGEDLLTYIRDFGPETCGIDDEESLQNYVELLRCILTQADDESFDKNLALWFSTYVGDLELVKKYSKDADINTTDDFHLPVLSLAVQGGYYDVVAFLIEKGANVNLSDDAGYTALHIVALDLLNDLKDPEASIKIASLLLKNGAEVDIPDTSFDGSTPLFKAVNNNDLAMAKLLLEHGADPNFKDYTGNTPIKHASKLQDDSDMIRLLKKFGATV